MERCEFFSGGKTHGERRHVLLKGHLSIFKQNLPNQVISAPSPKLAESKILSMNGEELLRFYVDQLKNSMDRRRMIFTDTALLAVIDDRGDVVSFPF